MRAWIKLHHQKIIPYFHKWSNEVFLTWMKLLPLAGASSVDGCICITKEYGYSIEILSSLMNIPIEILKPSLEFLKNNNEITITESNVLIINKWGDYQTQFDSEKRKQRRKEKELDITGHCPPVSADVQSNPSVSAENCIDNRLLDNRLLDNRLKTIDNNIYSSGCEPEHCDPIPYNSIIEYLNLRLNSRYRVVEKTKRLIKARYSEGFREEDFKEVIDKKYSEWLGTEWEKFLRPETLFGTKFESYLNQSSEAIENKYKIGKSGQHNLIVMQRALAKLEKEESNV